MAVDQGDTDLALSTDENWTDDELRAAVEAYRTMFVWERAGKYFRKSRVVADLRAGALSRRSESSVSRRMNNISHVLEGLGIERMRGYSPLTHVGSGVRARLERVIREAWGDDAMRTLDPPPPSDVRVVPVGEIKQESFGMAGVNPRVARRQEQMLVLRYTAFAATRGRSLVAHEYEGRLRCDLFDETLDVLIEAKADARRESARMALGQLLDYRRYEHGQPRLAVLLPLRPAPPTLDFLLDNRVDVVWEDHAGSFADTCAGAFS